MGNLRRCRGELGSRVAPRAVAPARRVPPASCWWPPHGARRRRAGRAGPGPGTRALAPSSGPRRLRPGRDVGSFQPACGASPVSRGAGAPRAACAGSAIGAPLPEVAGAVGEAADCKRAITATATATVTAPRAARSRSGVALRRAHHRIPARIWAPRARPPLSLSRRRQTLKGGQREGRRIQDAVPTPGSRGTSDLCNCCHFGVWCFAAVASTLAACSLGSGLPWLPEATGRRRPEAARRVLSTMRTLGTCLVTLAGLLLTAAGETFSGKRDATTVPGAPGT